VQRERVQHAQGLGKAFSYLLKYWPKLTLFLSKAGTSPEQ